MQAAILSLVHGSTIQRLVNLPRGSTHRTNHGEFLWRSNFDETAVVQMNAKWMPKKLYKKVARRTTGDIIDKPSVRHLFNTSKID